MAAGALCQWVHAMKIYAEIYREVEPKRSVQLNWIQDTAFWRFLQKKRLPPTSREYRRYEIYWNLIVAYSCGIVTFPLHNNQGPTPGSIFVSGLFLQEQASASSREAGVKAKAVARGQCRALPGNPESVVDSYPWVVWGFLPLPWQPRPIEDAIFQNSKSLSSCPQSTKT